jgi:hypothetical protein
MFYDHYGNATVMTEVLFLHQRTRGCFIMRGGQRAGRAGKSKVARGDFGRIFVSFVFMDRHFISCKDNTKPHLCCN